MATTTTNYGFDVPTSSDLVKNGATAISTLGQDIDTFLFRPFTKNALYNSSMQIWQRGTSFTVPTAGGEYTADRWYAAFSGIAGRTLSRQAGTSQFPYVMRVARDSGNTAVNNLQVGQSLEIADATFYAGQTVTFSYYARKGANYSATSDGLGVFIYSGTSSTEANRVTTAYAAGGVTDLSATTTLTSTLTRYSHTVTFGANVTQFAVKFTFTPTGTAGAADYFEITGLQFEVGSQVSPYRTLGGSIQGEIAACQRYYYRATAATFNINFGMGQCFSTTQAYATIPFPVPMRTQPTALEQNGTASDYRLITSGFGAVNLTSVPAFNSASVWQGTVTGAAASGLVAGNATAIASTNGGAYLGWSAEL